MTPTVPIEATEPVVAIPTNDQIQNRVALIRSSWSESERKGRRELGEARRDLLLSALGLLDQDLCA